MFIEHQRLLMADTLVDGSLSIKGPPKNQFLKFCKQEYRERIENSVSAIFLGFAGFINGICRGLDEIAAGIITLRSQPFKFSIIQFIAGLLQGLALPLIGIINIFAPTIAYAIIEKIAAIEINIFDSNVYDPFDEVTPPTTSIFNEIQAKIMSPLRGILCGIDCVAKTIYSLATLLFELPVYDEGKFGHKGRVLLFYVVSVALCPYAGIRGIFDRDACDELSINIAS